MTPTEKLRALLGIDHPVLLAPMAGISGGKLAAAVSRAGGFGLIGGGYGDPAWLDEQLRLANGTRCGVGFITWSLERQPALLDRVLEHGVPAIILSFGDIERFAPKVHDAGAVLLAQVQTVGQARIAAAAGANIIVAQGGEAGGHGGMRGTIALVPAVVDAVRDLPVVAAGGIADGRGAAAARMLGAAGVMCGTVFYASTESLAATGAKQRLVEANGDETTKSELFDLVRGRAWPPGPWQLRTLSNRFSDRWRGDVDGLRASLADQQRDYASAHQAGDFNTAAVIAGEAADLVRSVAPAEEIVKAIVRDCDRLLAGGH